MPEESRPLRPHPPNSPPPARSDSPDSGGVTIAAFQSLIRGKYHATDSARGVPATFMWFIEEVGELATALQDNAAGKSPTPEQRANLDEEFADVLAWLMTLANIAGSDGRGVDLERAIRKYTVQGGVEGVKN